MRRFTTSLTRRLRRALGCSSTGPYTRSGSREGRAFPARVGNTGRAGRPRRADHLSRVRGRRSCMRSSISRVAVHGADHGGADRAGGDRHSRAHDVLAARRSGAPGVYVDGAKIAALGRACGALLLPLVALQREHGPRALLRDRSLRHPGLQVTQPRRGLLPARKNSAKS